MKYEITREELAINAKLLSKSANKATARLIVSALDVPLTPKGIAIRLKLANLDATHKNIAKILAALPKEWEAANLLGFGNDSNKIAFDKVSNNSDFRFIGDILLVYAELGDVSLNIVGELEPKPRFCQMCKKVEISQDRNKCDDCIVPQLAPVRPQRFCRDCKSEPVGWNKQLCTSCKSTKGYKPKKPRPLVKDVATPTAAPSTPLVAPRRLLDRVKGWFR